MSDLNDLSRPTETDTEPNVLDTLRAHVIRAATWSGWGGTLSKVAGIMSAVTTVVSGGLSLRLYRRNDANTSDDEIVSLPGVSIGGNAATASAAKVGSALRAELDDAVTTAKVLLAVAASASGGLGTYVFATRYINGDIAFGGICSGGTLYPVGAIYTCQFGSFGSLALDASSSPLLGSWMCMGKYDHVFASGVNAAGGASLWLRIA